MYGDTCGSLVGSTATLAMVVKAEAHATPRPKGSAVEPVGATVSPGWRIEAAPEPLPLSTVTVAAPSASPAGAAPTRSALVLWARSSVAGTPSMETTGATLPRRRFLPRRRNGAPGTISVVSRLYGIA